jgi:hypothetical protein
MDSKTRQYLFFIFEVLLWHFKDKKDIIKQEIRYIWDYALALSQREGLSPILYGEIYPQIVGGRFYCTPNWSWIKHDLMYHRLAEEINPLQAVGVETGADPYAKEGYAASVDEYNLHKTPQEIKDWWEKITPERKSILLAIFKLDFGLASYSYYLELKKKKN